MNAAIPESSVPGFREQGGPYDIGSIEGAAPANFVVEFIGGPGSGKTTMASAVAAAMRDAGRPVHLIVSTRPGEGAQDETGLGLPGARFVTRVLRALHALSTSAQERDPVASQLLSLMPLPAGIARLRRRRYLGWLARDAGRGFGIVIRDQGYLCAIAGLALDSGRTEPSSFATALATIPLPDLVVRVSSSACIIRKRLNSRLEAQGWAERLLERDAAEVANIEMAFDSVQAGLASLDRRIITVSGANIATLGPAVEAVMGEMLARLRHKETVWI